MTRNVIMLQIRKCNTYIIRIYNMVIRKDDKFEYENINDERYYAFTSYSPSSST